MKTTVIFGVDGTLVDTNWMHVESWFNTFKKFGVEVAKEDILPMIGTGGEKITKKFFSPEQAAESAEAAIKTHSENMSKTAKTAKVFPQVRELFQELRRRGKKIVLATSARQNIVDAHIKNMGVGDLVDAVVSSNEVKHTKPDPDIFIKALEKAVASSTESVVIGDTVWDIVAANKAGIPTVAVLTGGNPESDLRQAGAVEVYKDIADLLSRLDHSMIR